MHLENAKLLNIISFSRKYETLKRWRHTIRTIMIKINEKVLKINNLHEKVFEKILKCVYFIFKN